jgi:integrase/recombinase XerD
MAQGEAPHRRADGILDDRQPYTTTAKATRPRDERGNQTNEGNEGHKMNSIKKATGDQMNQSSLMRREVLTPANLPVATVSPAAAYLASLASGSRRAMAGALELVARSISGSRDVYQFDWSSLRYEHVAAIRAELAGRYSPAYCNKLLSAVKGVMKSAWRLGLLSSDEYHRAVDVRPVTGSRVAAGRALESGEVAALFHSCSGTDPVNIRDAALLAVMYGGGLRRSELVGLNVDQWDGAAGGLTVIGKGNKERLVYLSSTGARLLERWLELRGSEPGPLFLPVASKRRSSFADRRMTGQAVLYILAARADLAKVAAFSPHDMRRSFISTLLDAGADIATVQKMAGHSRVETTARYDRRPEATKRKAAELIHLPVSF